MLCTLFWPFMFPFCWEAADVHIMSPHVLSEVPVVVDIGFVALGQQSQVQHMMIMDGGLQLIQKPEHPITQEQKFQHPPCKPEEGTVFRKHTHGVSNNSHEQ